MFRVEEARSQKPKFPGSNDYVAFHLTTEEMRKIGNECAESTKVDRKLVENAVKYMIIVDDQKYKEFLFCSYKKQGYQKKNGDIVYDEIKSFLSSFYSKEETDYAVDNCKGLTYIRPEEMSFNTMKCILKNLLEVERMKAQKKYVNN
ncbi:PREDICTED: uncharacterized protein LOC108567616 [Nicrophorus vespilloides]|uniref:Uncharacterized protein LOC108567616 n=1 Tax=Nicrophorus vespilloides TaxID=110193 RepID=A0ABM1NA33_NICVS|nr:PREDICTED: uncharacterized protein LOC108567616 [Nicrophorus vespilloides]